MAKRIIHIVLWSFAIILIGVSFGFSLIESRKIVCQDVKVAINDSADIRFLNGNEIEHWVKAQNRILGKGMNAINIRKIEDRLRSFQPIKDVAVYTNVYENGMKNSGAVVISIKQREPVCRVIGSGRTYYIDQYGKYINWSPRFTPRVIVVGGNFSNEYATNRLLPLISYINKDWFWSAQIDQIYVNPKGEINMIPRVGDQTIIFGPPEDYPIKFRNLKALYAEGFKSGGWAQYKSINIKYLNQIICTKK